MSDRLSEQELDWLAFSIVTLLLGITRGAQHTARYIADQVELVKIKYRSDADFARHINNIHTLLEISMSSTKPLMAKLELMTQVLEDVRNNG